MRARPYIYRRTRESEPEIGFLIVYNPVSRRETRHDRVAQPLLTAAALELRPNRIILHSTKVIRAYRAKRSFTPIDDFPA